MQKDILYNEQGYTELIKKFMGFDAVPFEHAGIKGYHVTLRGIKETSIYHTLSNYGEAEPIFADLLKWPLPYREHYDLMMPVVEKIEKELGFNVKIENSFVSVRITSNSIGYFETSKGHTFGFFNEISKKDALFWAIVETIEWYNRFLENKVIK